MLDSTQKSLAIAAALLPITATTTTPSAEKCGADAARNAHAATRTATTATTNSLTSTKAKNIFSWLKSATKSFDSAECNNSNNHANSTYNNYNNKPSVIAADSAHSVSVSVSADCTCESVAAERARAKSPDATLRDFRGVQSLRHLWNKRISAHEESRYRSFGQSKANKLTKSIGCLVNATNACDAPHAQTDALRGSQRQGLQAKRAQSLHDCTQLEEAEQQAEEQQQQQSHQQLDTEIDFLHREKDNFYKYKTAEQATKLLALEALTRGKTRRSSAGIVASGSVAEDAHFPAVETSAKGERIHWLKRQDIVAKRRETPTQAADTASCNAAMAIRDKRVNDDKNTSTVTHLSGDAAALISSKRASDVCQVKILATAADDDVEHSSELSISSSDGTLTAANSPQHGSSARVAPRDGTSAKRGSTDSSSTASSVTVTRSARRTSSASSRKCSFKTHARTYHTPRKMVNSNNNKDGGGASGAAAGGAAGYSMVAKLTQQFNEIIQKDKSLLQEVKRKHGVLMSRGGHVYKVLESSELSRAAATPSTGRTSMVQRNIKKFECGDNSAGGGGGDTKEQHVEKPTVPAKSLHVLRKRSELVSGLTNTSSSSNNKRLHLNLLPIQNGAQPELQLKRTQICQPPLEMVKEEAKTPLDNEERSVAAAATDVPNAELSISTYDVGSGNFDGDKADVRHTKEAAIKAALMCATAQSQSQIPTQTQTQLSVDNAAVVGHENLPPPVATELAERSVAPQALSALATVEADFTTVGSATDAGDASETASIATVESVTPHSADELDAEAASDEKQKQRKHKYAKIYEKFRFRSPFSLAAPSKKLSPNKSAEQKTDAEKMPQAELPVLAARDAPEPEAKILDALQVIDQKLKGLHSEPDTTTATPALPPTTPTTTMPIVLRENDDFEQRVLPNNSFIYQASTQQVCNNELIVTQAVNVALVNNIEGEQMFMEQKELQQQAANAQLLAEALYIKAGDCVESSSMQQLPAPVVIEPMELVALDEEEIYEPIATVEQPKTENSIKMQKAPIASATPTAAAQQRTQSLEDIYQTVEEARQQVALAPTSAAAAAALASAEHLLNDYESIAGSCEQTIPPLSASRNQPSPYFDDYEIFEPPSDELTPQTAITPTTAGTIVRNTNDELPELPKPKRRLPKSPMPGKRPPKPAALAAANSALAIPTPAMLELLDDNYYADDENIYDTIKGSHCYESLHSECVKLQKSASSKGSDSLSLTSNCYESITHYRRLVVNNGHATGSSSGSTLTISSDQKTNSLYEMSLAAGLLYGTGSMRCRSSTGGGSSGHNSSGTVGAGSSDGDARSHTYCHSNAASSDNSDAWIDISDAEADGGQAAKQQFIVVRERSKVHRSPDWSKRVRDKRLQQKKAMSCIEDDSDHYYESLSPLGNKRHSTQLVQRTNSHHKRNQDLPRYAVGGATRCSKKYSASAHVLGTGISDDYDSFDTDTDEIYETEEQLKNHNDSGVDIRHIKLPDPPSSTNQVYAMVRKFKNFISNKKSPSAGGKHGGSQQKIYENSSQFYVENNVYEDTPKSKLKSHKSAKKSPLVSQQQQQDDVYENTEFHAPPPIIETANKPLSTSDKNLSVHDSSTDQLGSSTTLRPKSKASKSFKSRLRKSLGGATFDNKQLSILTPTRSTFYIEDPSHGGSGELDSGFSEKASSGDLPVALPIPTPEAQRFSTVARKAKKEAKAASAQRRRTTIGIRPHEPPPPPPSEDATIRVKQQQGNGVATTNQTTTSWYAECGVFKHAPINYAHDDQSLSGSKSTHSQSGSMSTNGNSWYAEAGLYQTSGVSVASSSGSSGVSTGNEGGMGDDMPHSLFLNEPLYQIYSAEKLESISRDMEEHDGSTDGYEEVGQHRSAMISADTQRRSRPTALQLVGPKNGPSRTLWSEIPEVINSCILPTLTPRERGLQEAKFEVITSEASYLKSLNLLRSHFMHHPLFRDTSIVSARDRKSLFAYIVPVHECSERLLTELESCWQDNIMLLGLSRRIYSVAERYFHVYIAFCEHQGRMDRTLRRLKEAKGVFSQNLDLLEASSSCYGLNLHSFLMLPMQRITRLPLLIDAVFSKVSPYDDEYESWKMTLAIMNKIVTQCNEAANRCEQAYEIERISRQLEFPSSVRALAIAPAGVSAPGTKPRFLVKKGELTHLIWRGDDAKLTFGKKFTKSNIYAFLFSDLLVLTKRKGEELFYVFDYCPRSMLTLTSGDALPQLPTKDVNQTGKNLILMTLLENHERKTIELVLSCPSVSEQERWLQAMRPPEPDTPGEKLYEQWDCPQVITKHPYEAKEPDVLNLELGDVVNVSRKLPDGWYQGERIRDGAIGWFPGTYTEEVNSAHVRARNLKQRHRLLTFTATYLESQKRK